jgi:hypothetical protein
LGNGKKGKIGKIRKFLIERFFIYVKDGSITDDEYAEFY